MGNITAYRESLERKILETAIALFKKKGIKAVRMDDIATDVGISKRTLYEIYSNKEELLLECLKNENEIMTGKMADAAKTAQNEMEIIAHFIKLKLADLETINPLFFTEINKYERIVRFFEESKSRQSAHSQEFMKCGIEHGFFRNDLNYDIVSKMGDAAMNYVMQTRLYERYRLDEIFHTFMIVFLRGCCTEKGIASLDKLIMKSE